MGWLAAKQLKMAGVNACFITANKITHCSCLQGQPSEDEKLMGSSEWYV
jgi:hypothetical protein